ncbi:hypothetical protein OROMI_021996 [Orobanche minor]
MALISCYSSNLEPFQQFEYYSSSESSSVIDQFITTQQTEQLSPDFNQLQAFPDIYQLPPDDEYLFYSSSEINPSTNYYNINSLIDDNLMMRSNDNMIDIEPFNYSHDQYFIDDGLVQNPNPNCLTDLLPPAPQPSETFFISPETLILPSDHFPISCGSLLKKETTAAGGLSAQSIAARQRRRKIAERTHELGKLVPGGQKMNTAEMLQAAYKYIKFLQAQVRILQFLDSYHQENKNGEPSSESEEELDLMQLHVLLQSPLIQEKLYSTGKCLIPMKFAFAQEIISSENDQMMMKFKQENRSHH